MKSAAGKKLQDDKPQSGSLESKRAKIFVWVGSATALISLVLGGNQVWTLVTNRLAHRQQVNNLIASARMQQDAHDFSAAWTSLESAASLASDPRLPALREDLAMRWSEDSHLKPGETFSDFAKKLEPVLTRGVTAATNPARKADLLAHLGWCAFLRRRDGDNTLDPAQLYEQAVKLDPKNPYANAMWGHWILWNHRDLSDARSHFDAALSSGRDRAYVRDLQIRAWLNSHSDDYQDEALRVANDIRKEGGKLSENSQSGVADIYLDLARNDTRRAAICAAAPPLEQIETIRWLYSGYPKDSYKALVAAYSIAVMQEAAGQKENARLAYQTILKTAPKYSMNIPELAQKGLARTK